MIRTGDVVHASVFAGCIAGGALVLHLLHRNVLQGMGYGLVAWVVLMLLYMAVQWRLQRAKTPPQSQANIDDDDTAFEVEDGKND